RAPGESLGMNANRSRNNSSPEQRSPPESPHSTDVLAIPKLTILGASYILVPFYIYYSSILNSIYPRLKFFRLPLALLYAWYATKKSALHHPTI
ncbi:hypothetical protein CLAFUW4_10581, partial [Fulvia fulva]